MNKSISCQAVQWAFFFALLILPCCSFSQKMTTCYFDKMDQKISRSEFKKQERKGGLGINYAIGDSMIYKIVPRKSKGQLDSVVFVELKEYLEKLDTSWIAPDEKIVIVYFPGQDVCNQSMVNDSTQLMNALYYPLKKEWGNEEHPVRLFYLFKKGVGDDLGENGIPWLEDAGEMVEKMYFKYHYPCYSSIIINTDGNYQTYFGKHSCLSVIKTVQKFNSP